VQSNIDCRRLRALQSCLRFNNGYLVANASVIGCAHNFECFPVGFHRVVEKFLQRVLAANLKEVTGQGWPVQSAVQLEVGRGHWLYIDWAHCIADSIPEIGFPMKHRPGEKTPETAYRQSSQCPSWTDVGKMFESGVGGTTPLWENTGTALHAPGRELP